ncbi:MAG: MAPEG family protein [Caulobacterales bacterium]
MEVTAAAHAAALWAGLNLILLLVLSLLVVRQRQQHKVLFGDGGVPQLAQAIRAFGNAAEYVPIGVIGLAVLALAGAPALAIHFGGLVLISGRIAHAVGLSRSTGSSGLRSAGMILTWIAYIYTAVALIIFAIG